MVDLISKTRRLNLEVVIARIGIILGLAVSIGLAPKDITMLLNALFFWLPQLFVLAILWMLKPRSAVFAGVAVALALYLAIFGVCIHLSHDRDSLGWLGYFFSFPGAIAGALGAVFLLRKRPLYSILSASSTAASLVFIGLLVNQTVVCNTVMYCGRLSLKAWLIKH
jgi:hypothetical protein